MDLGHAVCTLWCVPSLGTRLARLRAHWFIWLICELVWPCQASFSFFPCMNTESLSHKRTPVCSSLIYYLHTAFEWNALNFLREQLLNNIQYIHELFLNLLLCNFWQIIRGNPVCVVNVFLKLKCSERLQRLLLLQDAQILGTGRRWIIDSLSHFQWM